MRRVRKTAATVLVFVTTASMLLASTPHFVCRCPDGTVKRFCFASASSQSACCCNGCCGAAAVPAKSCCKAAAKLRKSQHADDGAGPRVTTPGCQKTLAETHAAVRIHPETKSVDPWIGSAVAFLVLSHSLPPAAPEKHVWKVDRAPPPTHLLTILQRLTI